MRAAYIEQTGGADQIKVGDLPLPELGPGQVRVKVGAVSFNPIDLYVRSGMVAMPMAFPYILGSDVAGTVDEVGQGVTGLKVGDRVWGSNQGLMGRPGAASEFANVDAEWLYLTPANLDDTQAAAIALTGITAHLGLFRTGQLKAGETVYVPGGSGGVGSMVVQMAKAAGARVATSAGSPERVKLAESLGADLALNYKTDDIPAALRQFSPEGIDVWYDTLREHDLEVSVPLLRKRGRMILIAGRTSKPSLPVGSFYPRDCSLLGFAMFNASADEQRTSAVEMSRWAGEGKLKPIIGKVFPLEETRQAQEFLEQNTSHGAGTLSGKVVVTVA
ncbi:NADPH:quinone reductase [Isosphaeraceae bacterium EP7]